ncbi:methyl-accepting chemotaxis protein [Paraburkholderia caledonica]|uniref:methyl-accepting chemotaxis protein n=1 Tax=Paraburkholderia caledonica TaxID=134536 RepID=UPI000B3F9EB6|nr:methyl-accepting chemotaxis protein [Paraburkholderia caledonica]
MFREMSFRSKIILLVAVAVTGIAVICTGNFFQTRRLILDSQRVELRTAVETAYNIVANYQTLAAKGAMSEDEAKRAAADAVRASRFEGKDGKTEYFYIYTMEGVGVMHPFHPEFVGQNVTDKIRDGNDRPVIRILLDALARSPNGRAYIDSAFSRPGQSEIVEKLQYVMAEPGWNWMIGSGLYMDDVDRRVWLGALENSAVGAIMLVLVILLGAVVSRSVLSQLGGDPRVAVGLMRKIAKRDLSERLEGYPAGSLLGELASMMDGLRETVSSIRESVGTIESASAEIASASGDLSARTERASASLQETAASMEEITSAVAQAGDSASSAEGLAKIAQQSAIHGAEVVTRVVTRMQDIDESSRQISTIIGVIDGIAAQTNILALNAAVEAARAGTNGQGFAVVAAEVRALAQRSSQAAREIKVLVASSAEATKSGAELVGYAGEAMKSIVEQVDAVSTLIREINRAALEQKDGISQVNAAVGHIDSMTQENALLVQQSSSAADGLKILAESLSDEVADFRLL